MAQNGHNEHPKYMWIFLWLAVLTAIEVAVFFLNMPKVILIILLIGLACAKAILVAAYFMHLKFEKRTLAVIVITPFLICVFLVIMLMPDLTSDKRHADIEKPAAEVVNTNSH